MSAGDGCRGFEDVIMDEVKSLKQINICTIVNFFVKSPQCWLHFSGLSDLSVSYGDLKVDDLKREFAKKEGEPLTLSYKINVEIIFIDLKHPPLDQQ